MINKNDEHKLKLAILNEAFNSNIMERATIRGLKLESGEDYFVPITRYLTSLTEQEDLKVKQFSTIVDTFECAEEVKNVINNEFATLDSKVASKFIKDIGTEPDLYFENINIISSILDKTAISKILRTVKDAIILPDVAECFEIEFENLRINRRDNVNKFSRNVENMFGSFLFLSISYKSVDNIYGVKLLKQLELFKEIGFLNNSLSLYECFRGDEDKKFKMVGIQIVDPNFYKDIFKDIKRKA